MRQRLVSKLRVLGHEGDGPIFYRGHRPPDAGVYVPLSGQLGEGFALQTDQETHEFSREANAPAWRNEVAMSSLEAILEHAPSKSVELIAPRPLLLILAKDDEVSSSDLIRETFARAGEPKRLLEVEGGHYAVYPWSGGQSADEAIQAATDWFTDHLAPSTPRSEMAQVG